MSHIILVGQRAHHASPLVQAISKLEFEHKLHITPSIDKTLHYIDRLWLQRDFLRPDLIILMQAAIMPHYSVALAKLRSHRSMFRTPIIVITRVADAGLRKTLLRQGVGAVVAREKLDDAAREITDAVVEGWLTTLCSGCWKVNTCSDGAGCTEI